MVPIIPITGGPSTGKSTSLRLLREAGFPVAEEQARPLIESGFINLEDHYHDFQVAVISRQLAAEEQLLAHGKPFFVDRGVFDTIAYCNKAGKPAPAFLHSMPKQRYAMAFVMEHLGHFVSDGVRSENLQFTIDITPLLVSAYEERGIPVVCVPAMSPEKRHDFILEQAKHLLHF